MSDTVRIGSALPTLPPIERSDRRIGLVPAVPLLVLAIVVLAAILAPLLTPYEPVKSNLIDKLIPPSWVAGGSPEHWLGTDGFGRDVFTRLLYGARVSLLVAVFSLVIAVVIGTAVGVAAGFLGGAFDSALMRLVDIVLALPTILVALMFAVAVGPSFQNLVLILGFLIWPRIARLIRGETMVLMKQDFVRYPLAIGVGRRMVAWRHIFPNVLPTLLVATTLEIGHVILVEASLSFLGAGVPPPQASWGVMIDDGRALIATGWWVALFPGLAITVTVLACNGLGDWLRDTLDPKTSER
jgi:peptide/nickel transport system permease protein